MKDHAAAIIEQADDEARRVWRATSIDLDHFLALPKGERPALWRTWDLATKQQVVCKMLTREHGDWAPAAVAHWVAHYDRKWAPVEPAPVEAPASDMPIPPVAEILTRVTEDKQLAAQHGDIAGATQLDRVRANLLRGARVWWCGDLLVQSVNNPSAVYSVSKRGCTCPNGAAGKAECWHVALYELLETMAEDRAAARDIVVDAAQARRELGRRLAVARGALMQTWA